jgi:two-component system LytT family sensor kinase
MEAKWYEKKWMVILLHAVCWIFIFSLPYLLRPTLNTAKPPGGEQHSAALNLRYMLNDLIYVGVFYLNAGVFIPKFIYRRKYKQFALVMFISFVLLLFVTWTVMFQILGQRGFNLRGHILFNFFFFLLFSASSTAYGLIKDRIRADRIAREKQTENLKTELSLLRSQVSPHFMFNIMNNMVALARKGSSQLEPSLIKLSSLLRYMLYETHERVPLQKEIEYLQSYIDLQRQRFGNNVAVKSCMQKIDRDYEIEPMLLIPFVENAFKHGTGFVTKAEGSDLILYHIAEIDIKLTAEKGVLNFCVQNRYNEDSSETRDKTSGIGLTNVKRRLNLLYHNHHSLHIEKKDGWFITSLEIILD